MDKAVTKDFKKEALVQNAKLVSVINLLAVKLRNKDEEMKSLSQPILERNEANNNRLFQVQVEYWCLKAIYDEINALDDPEDKKLKYVLNLLAIKLRNKDEEMRSLSQPILERNEANNNRMFQVQVEYWFLRNLVDEVHEIAK